MHPITTRGTLFLRGALAAAVALSAGGCDLLSSGGDDGGTSKPPDAGAPPPGLVTFKRAGEKVQAAFTTGSEQYLVVPYSVSTVSADDIEFTVKVTSAAGRRSYPLRYRVPRRPRLDLLRQRHPALWARWQDRLAVERWARGLARSAALLPASPPLTSPIAACKKSSDCASGKEVCHRGTCAARVTLKVSTFASSARTIDATVARTGKHAAILVGAGETVSKADLDALMAAIDGNIFACDTGLFGAPALPSGGAAYDRNGDGLIWVVVTGKVKEKKNAVGFFVATDFTDAAASNKADILYIRPPGAGTRASAIATIMAHELQHLLHYAAKVYLPKASGGRSGGPATLWLDEGLSHFAEDACGYGGENVTLLDEKLFPSFSETSLLSTSDSLEARAMAMLYLRHLFERRGGAGYGSGGAIVDRGGAAWLKRLHRSSARGAAAVTATAGDWRAAFDRYMAAIALDGRGVTRYRPYLYDALVRHPVTGAMVGVKIRGRRTDATGKQVTLKGPLEERASAGSTDDTIANATGKLFLLRGQKGATTVTVTSTAKDFRFALVKVK